jgi:hypothetical protein
MPPPRISVTQSEQASNDRNSISTKNQERQSTELSARLSLEKSHGLLSRIPSATSDESLSANQQVRLHTTERRKSLFSDSNGNSRAKSANDLFEDINEGFVGEDDEIITSSSASETSSGPDLWESSESESENDVKPNSNETASSVIDGKETPSSDQSVATVSHSDGSSVVILEQPHHAQKPVTPNIIAAPESSLPVSTDPNINNNSDNGNSDNSNGKQGAQAWDMLMLALLSKINPKKPEPASPLDNLGVPAISSNEKQQSTENNLFVSSLRFKAAQKAENRTTVGVATPEMLPDKSRDSLVQAQSRRSISVDADATLDANIQAPRPLNQAKPVEELLFVGQDISSSMDLVDIRRSVSVNEYCKPRKNSMAHWEHGRRNSIIPTKADKPSEFPPIKLPHMPIHQQAEKTAPAVEPEQKFPSRVFSTEQDVELSEDEREKKERRERHRKARLNREWEPLGLPALTETKRTMVPKAMVAPPPTHAMQLLEERETILPVTSYKPAEKVSIPKVMKIWALEAT